MNTNKIGIMFIVAVLALAGIGASYAGFTDTITITGTATTGSVDVVIEKLSGTWVWKITEDANGGEAHQLVIHHDWVNETDNRQVEVAGGNYFVDYPETMPIELDGTGVVYEIVAWAVPKRVDMADDAIHVNWFNLFPIQDTMEYDPNCFVVDALFHYVGKIPARLQDFSENWILDGDWVYELIDHDFVEARAFMSDETGTEHGETVYAGHQFHYCDYFKVEVDFDIPQDKGVNTDRTWGRDSYQGLLADATIDFDFIQFDEYDDTN